MVKDKLDGVQFKYKHGDIIFTIIKSQNSKYLVRWIEDNKVLDKIYNSYMISDNFKTGMWTIYTPEQIYELW